MKAIIKIVDNFVFCKSDLKKMGCVTERKNIKKESFKFIVPGGCPRIRNFCKVKEGEGFSRRNTFSILRTKI
jgi:hypothetical protein